MKTIVLFGAGKSATVLIDYLIAEAAHNHWKILIADASREQVLAKTGGSPFTEAIQLDITDTNSRSQLLQKADIVISMMPPALHVLVARDCVRYSKHLLTASYVDDAIRSLQPEITAKKLLFLCEMGLDPGIDHMSAMKLIDGIKAAGGTVSSFKSHCGGLVAPESDDNPWHYKISWNPRNVVMAGKAGAIYKLNGNTITESYTDLFNKERGVAIGEGIGFLAYYPNRDSLGYMETYGLQSAETFVRTTLRYPDFMYGWKNIIALQLTSEEPVYDTDGMSLATFFRQHLSSMKFGEWLNKQLEERLNFVSELTEKINQLTAAEEKLKAEQAIDPSLESVDEFAVVDPEGNFQEIDISQMKDKAAYAIAHKMHEANLTLQQLFFLGMDDEATLINKGKCSAADVLQFALEHKLALHPSDKDMIVMLHEFEYLLGTTKRSISSCLLVKGEDSLRTAMAKTVGLPLGIAAKLILNGSITVTGLHIPTIPEIYEPVLEELGKMGIRFKETEG